MYMYFSAQEWLARVHAIPNVPLNYCHKKIKEQIKVHLIAPATQQVQYYYPFLSNAALDALNYQ